jgi:Mn-containing catalase
MLNSLCCTEQSLRAQVIKKLRSFLYDRDDFTQGEYIEALDEVRQSFEQRPDVSQEELDEIVKSLTQEWKDISEVIRVDNQSQRTTNLILIVAGITAFVTGLITWMLMRDKK